ncbi:MAG: hypothetical protein QNI84_14140 [Henriciella sp.]|nr:hypothetical protein [Henriciella sp.]
MAGIVSKFTGKAAAMVGAGALALSPMVATANAQEANVVPASVIPVSFSEDAENAAGDWAKLHPDGISFAVFYGTGQGFSPEFIQDKLVDVATTDSCVSEVGVFFEQNDQPGTGFSVFYDGHYETNLRMGEVLPFTDNVAVEHICTGNEIIQTAEADTGPEPVF